jgi:putative ABC transport system ATP-binding protein
MTAIVELKQVKKDYELGKTIVPALHEINLTIQVGEFMAVAGISGSGKSTILNIIGCIDTPTSGQYLLKGKDVSQLDETSLTKIRRNHIGYIFQSFNLVPVLSAFENIEYPLLLDGSFSIKERREQVHYFMNEIGIYDQRKQFPNELSGGQRQRVAIARALVKKPEIVLADEPTANLDSVTGIRIIELLKKLNEEQKITFIFSSHDHKVIDYADRVEELRDGRIVGQNKEEEFVNV